MGGRYFVLLILVKKMAFVPSYEASSVFVFGDIVMGILIELPFNLHRLHSFITTCIFG